MQTAALSPPWASAFWRGVPRYGPALDNFLALTRSLSAGSDAQSDAALIKVLVEAGRYGEASEIRTALADRNDLAAGGAETRYAPLDWQLAQSRSAQARWSAAGQLGLYVEAGTGGELTPANRYGFRLGLSCLPGKSSCSKAWAAWRRN